MHARDLTFCFVAARTKTMRTPDVWSDANFQPLKEEEKSSCCSNTFGRVLVARDVAARWTNADARDHCRPTSSNRQGPRTRLRISTAPFQHVLLLTQTR
ncbi:uncharacterized protein CTRU02_213912 [Colletotrichum truncatum]|uniref:Uncharacterized protein n=1 Tax=Colletotrichum truncatum TaxID=5467 RepID=A0ACC3YH21_COLTU|nr:uncharacterized protein CTRU02_06226 [Colletotrichum truncatum]KAF6792730.1 hypothetical protein CTRU02_06226 [Colletotrichum truncatum]